jgi:hypothetical protein
VRAGKREEVEVGERAPFSGEFSGEGLGIIVYMSVGGAEGDAVRGDGVFDGGEERRLQMGKAAGTSSAAEEFEVGKFPKVAVDGGRGALADEDEIAVLKNVSLKAPLAWLFAGWDLWKFGDTIVAKGFAGGANGTLGTERLARGADGGAEFHQALIEGGGGFRGSDELGAEIPEA